MMQIEVHFYSYFKELAGCQTTTLEVRPSSSLGELLRQVFARFPRLAEMEKSLLVAVGVEYQDRHYVLQPQDVVSLFPPVQGG